MQQTLVIAKEFKKYIMKNSKEGVKLETFQYLINEHQKQSFEVETTLDALAF